MLEVEPGANQSLAPLSSAGEVTLGQTHPQAETLNRGRRASQLEPHSKW